MAGTRSRLLREGVHDVFRAAPARLPGNCRLSAPLPPHCTEMRADGVRCIMQLDVLPTLPTLWLHSCRACGCAP